jgi:hypothetical protein
MFATIQGIIIFFEDNVMKLVIGFIAGVLYFLVVSLLFRVKEVSYIKELIGG